MLVVNQAELPAELISWTREIRKSLLDEFPFELTVILARREDLVFRKSMYAYVPHCNVGLEIENVEAIGSEELANRIRTANPIDYWRERLREACSNFN